MKIFNFPEKTEFEKTAVALGSFDGVHTAHRIVIENCIKLAAENNLKSGVLLFKNPIKPVKIISELAEKIYEIKKTGVDFIYLCEFDEKFKRQSPEEFVAFLKNTINVHAISAGFDYRFGYKAQGDAKKLAELAENNNIKVIICNKFSKNRMKVSSTNIRKMIESGDLDNAENLLGRPFSLSGVVEHGFQNGRKLGFATANLLPGANRVLPPDGVYGGVTHCSKGSYPSVINIGTNPTFNGKKRTVESHLINFSGDLYGQKITVEFDMFIRGEKKFKSVEELKKQIQKDKKRMENKMTEFQCLILAADMGTAMKSEIPTILHKICGKTIGEWLLDSVEQAGASHSCMIVGHKSELIKEVIGNRCDFIIQKEQAEDFIKNNSGHTLILNGNVPLITAAEIQKAFNKHLKNEAAVTVMSAITDNLTDYEPIVKDNNGNILNFEKFNSGLYIFENSSLLHALKHLKSNNITDTIKILLNSGLKAYAYTVENPEEILSVNNRIQLSSAEKIMQHRINEKHMTNGVTMILPETIIIEDAVNIGKDTVIYPNVILKSGTTIGENCVIGSNTQITASEIADNVDILSSVLLKCTVGKDTHIGPFAYLRPNTHVGENVKVGDFVELKNSNIDNGTKISHLTYVGDSDVGQRVNFGCGTVTVNYDGKNKHRTQIGDDCFIGCNTNLISPVKLENRAYTAAGSTITDTVPENNLAIARARQVNKDTWKNDPRTK